MAWICKYCSTNNDDDQDECFVCGQKRVIEEKVLPKETSTPPKDDTAHKPAPASTTTSTTARTSTPTPARTTTSAPARTATPAPAPTHTSSPAVRDDDWLYKIIAVATIIFCFIVGQVVQYLLYVNLSWVFCLTKFLRATANESFNIVAYLVITTILSAVAAGFVCFTVVDFIDYAEKLNFFLLIIPCCVSLLFDPAMSGILIGVCAVIIFVCRDGDYITAGLVVFAIVVAAMLAIFPSVAYTRDNAYIITFDKQGGEWGSDYVKVKEDEELPQADQPEREGYTFLGYYDNKISGNAYYNKFMQRVKKWDGDKNITIYAHWQANEYTITFDKQNGTNGSDKVTATYDDVMPNAVAPERVGYTFLGYFDEIEEGKQYYSPTMTSISTWDKSEDSTLYAQWRANSYKVTFDMQGGSGGTSTVYATYGSQMPVANAPSKTGYTFSGYYSGSGGTGTCYYNAFMKSVSTWDRTVDMTLYAYWKVSNLNVTASPSRLENISDKVTATISVSGGSGKYSYSVANIPSGVKCTFSGNELVVTRTEYDESGVIQVSVVDSVTGANATVNITYTTASQPNGGCVAAGTLITLADGSQVAVENLKGDESLLVWNAYSGTFDSAPVVFIDSDEYTEYQIIHLYFSDGTDVQVISEHAFWDYDENEYVFLREDAARYIGHTFAKCDEVGTTLNMSKVQLENVVIEQQYTSAYSPVTYGYLCYFVNGMLSMPGATEGLINIFSVTSGSLTYDSEKMAQDIATYGLFTYEEFAELVPVTKEFFDAFGGKYLKISIGKGYTTIEKLNALVQTYAQFMESDGE